MDAHTGVLLVGHGTRDPNGTRQFFELSDRLSDSLPGIPMEAALLEFQQPTIPEAWDSLHRRGVRHVHVAPLLLFAAGHAKQDIPDEIGSCQESTPGMTFDQSRPLSRHAAILELVESRVRDSLTQIPSPPERIAIVMVGRGNRDPCAQADMRVMTEIIRKRVSVETTTTAFYAMAQPALPGVLASVASTERYDQIIVYPHLLFEGRLLEAIKRQVSEAAEQFPWTQFRLAEHLGPDRLVALAIRGRIEQASATGVECR